MIRRYSKSSGRSACITRSLDAFDMGADEKKTSSAHCHGIGFYTNVAVMTEYKYPTRCCCTRRWGSSGANRRDRRYGALGRLPVVDLAAMLDRTRRVVERLDEHNKRFVFPDGPAMAIGTSHGLYRLDAKMIDLKKIGYWYSFSNTRSDLPLPGAGSHSDTPPQMPHINTAPTRLPLPRLRSVDRYRDHRAVAHTNTTFPCPASTVTTLINARCRGRKRAPRHYWSPSSPRCSSMCSLTAAEVIGTAPVSARRWTKQLPIYFTAMMSNHYFSAAHASRPYDPKSGLQHQISIHCDKSSPQNGRSLDCIVSCRTAECWPQSHRIHLQSRRRSHHRTRPACRSPGYAYYPSSTRYVHQQLYRLRRIS